MTSVFLLPRRSSNPDVVASIGTRTEVSGTAVLAGVSATDVSRAAVLAAVSAVPDPELGGVTIGELGLVHTVELMVDRAIAVTLLPTFLGCPALRVMERDVRDALGSLGICDVQVVWAHSPMWGPDRISTAGRVKLAELGIAVPDRDSSVDGALPVCPICSVAALEAKLPVGPTACRSVAWCTSCRSVVEIMRGSYAHL